MLLDTKPKISVLMPVYNAEKHLVQAIESVLNQTFRDFELIMLDDGSTDNSLEIIKYYASIDHRCKIYSRQNKGIILSRNELIGHAKAEIVANMDADDICLPLRLEKQYEYLQLHPECVVVTSPVTLIDDDGLTISKYWNHLTHEEIDQGNLAGGGAFICNPASTIRKAALIKAGEYRLGFECAEDIDLFLRIAELGRIGVVPEVLFKYRQHLSSVGYAKSKKQFDSMRLAVNEARLRRNMPLLEVSDISWEYDLSDVYAKWGWWALNEGNLKTARKYGFKLLKSNPFNLKHIKFNLCVLREMVKQ
jgi:glycosyltransferase involved in cell wall biosynthesis